jgi:hypothetical protein
MTKAIDFRLSRNAAGRLAFTVADGEVHEGVVPVRASPSPRRTRASPW